MEFVSFIFGVALYFAPTIIAYFRRDKVNLLQIAVINTLLGWTVIGWVVALIFAFGDSTRNQPQQINVHVNQQVGEGHTNTSAADPAYQAWLASQPDTPKAYTADMPVAEDTTPVLGRPGWKAE